VTLVSVADLENKAVIRALSTLEKKRGAGAAAIEDAAGRVHVVLRGSGTIFTIESPHDKTSDDTPRRARVPPEPRGIATRRGCAVRRLRPAENFVTYAADGSGDLPHDDDRARTCADVVHPTVIART